MNNVIQILMDRDGLTYEEAKEEYENAQAELMDAIEGNSVLTPEEVLLENLGLEMDYIFDFI